MTTQIKKNYSFDYVTWVSFPFFFFFFFHYFDQILKSLTFKIPNPLSLPLTLPIHRRPLLKECDKLVDSWALVRAEDFPPFYIERHNHCENVVEVCDRNHFFFLVFLYIMGFLRNTHMTKWGERENPDGV